MTLEKTKKDQVIDIKKRNMHAQKNSGSSKTKVKTKSNEKCLGFLLSYVLPTDATTILNSLGQNTTQAEIAEKASFSKQKVNYWVNKFLRYGAIIEKIGGKPKYYRLTPVGQKKLMGSENGKAFCILEDYPVKYRLIKDYGMIEWEKMGDPNNWVKLGVHLGTVTVVKTTKNIIIHTGQLSGSPDAVLMDAGNIRGAVYAFLASKGVVMDPIPEPLHDAAFKFYTKEAEIIHDQFGNIAIGGVRLDNSPPPKEFPGSIQRIPHLEGTKEFANDFLLQAHTVAEMSRKIDTIKNELIQNLERGERLQEKQMEIMEKYSEENVIHLGIVDGLNKETRERRREAKNEAEERRKEAEKRRKEAEEERAMTRAMSCVSIGEKRAEGSLV